MAEVKPTSTSDLTTDQQKILDDGKQAQADAVAAQEERDRIPPSPTQEENDRVALGLPVELADPADASDDAETAKKKADKKAADKAAADKSASESKAQAAASSGDNATYKTRTTEGN